MTTDAHPQQTQLQVFALGGTIDKIYFDALSEYQVGKPQIASIFQDAGLALQIEIESICCKDSLDIIFADRQALLTAIVACDTDNILVTHGTDTMTATAQYIQNEIQAHPDNMALAQKRIVFVGAMHPACFKQSDAPFNVGFALGVLRVVPAGVYIAMNGQVLNPQLAKKNRAAGQFESGAGS